MMNLDQNPNNSTAKKKKRRSYKIVAAIAAVFVLHFAWQFSFVQKENLRVVEDSLKNAQIEVLPVEIQPKADVAEIKTSLAEKIVDEKAPKNSLPIKFSPPENKRQQTELKKNPSRESKSVRLRRAEKLLTGF